MNYASAQSPNNVEFVKPDEPCLTIEVFSDSSCPHCKRAYEFLYKLQQENPEVVVIPRDLVFKSNLQRFIELSEEYGVEKPGTPSFLICEQFLVGFDNAENYGELIKYLMGLTDSTQVIASDSVIQLPVFGKITVEQIGLPLFTVIVGLIDGFNPCAMWVLLFLLSLLVNLKNRKKILLIAGTFVFISGAVYFAFMAAWLNLFLIIGFSRGIQITVGLIAVMIGLVHIKDFFAYKRGISLSIPEAAKPQLYSRIRNIIYADNMTAALIGVITIALLVNLVELVCTAGLPAMYTQILTLRELSYLQYYGYILLYNIAYIFDDGLMVGIVVYTLSRKKLQEKQGRWLKVLSGAVILGLGLLLLIRPNWLI